MADESLRLAAEVVDKFSGPLRSLQQHLRSIQAGPGVKQIRQEFEGVQHAAGRAANEVRSVLIPALGAIGLTGLSVTGALLGVGAALRGFSSNTAALSLLSREASITAERMRALESVAGRFGVAPEAMRQHVSDRLREKLQRYVASFRRSAIQKDTPLPPQTLLVLAWTSVHFFLVVGFGAGRGAAGAVLPVLTLASSLLVVAPPFFPVSVCFGWAST